MDVLPVKRFLHGVLPRSVAAWLARKRFLTCRPPVGWVRFGSLHRTRPVSAVWGHDRGQPINRRYIEAFVDAHALDVRGHVLEVGDARYTRRCGGERVTKEDVVDVVAGNPAATLVADLGQPDSLPAGAFDCILLTQVMQYVRDFPVAVRNLHRALRPGGVVLATLPGLERVSAPDDRTFGDFWRFTPRSAHALFAPAFGAEHTEVTSFGNVFAAVASLMGLAQEDVDAADLAVEDPHFPVILGVRARKGPG